jgi:Phosphotransferase enzyme family
MVRRIRVTGELPAGRVNAEDIGMGPLTWMSGPSVSELRTALRRALPDIEVELIVAHPRLEQVDPRWHSGSAVVGGAFVAKFAWSSEAAARIYREGQILLAVRSAVPHLCLPEVVAAGTDPVLVVTRLIPGCPLTAGVIATLDRRGVDRVAADLAAFLAGLHDPSVLNSVQHVVQMTAPQPQADTNSLRQRFGRWVNARRSDTVLGWCDWTDTVLAAPQPSANVLVHGDLHGDNEVWDMDVPALRAVLDFDSSGPIDAEFDFRYLPSQATRSELFAATVRHYQRESSRDLNMERIMAWHIRTVLGDALWRSEAGIALPENGSPTRWVDELAHRIAGTYTSPKIPRDAHAPTLHDLPTAEPRRRSAASPFTAAEDQVGPSSIRA